MFSSTNCDISKVVMVKGKGRQKVVKSAVESMLLRIFIVANCPGISGTVPDFLPVSRKGPENLL